MSTVLGRVNQGWLYTVLLYVSNDIVGGETGIADTFGDEAGRPTSGLVVGAVVGRLLVFSPGAEF